MSRLGKEKLLLEAMKNLLKQDNLGITKEGLPKEETAHNLQFQFEAINDSFATKIKDSPFFDALHTTFYNIHTYKWISDPLFDTALINNLRSQGIPEKEIENAIKALQKVRKEFLKKNEGEQDIGWNADIDDMKIDPKNKPVSDTSKETFSGDNKPFTGIEPDKTRPTKIK